MKIIVADTAKEDIINIYRYIVADNAKAAKKTIKNLKKILFNISLFPDIGTKKKI